MTAEGDRKTDEVAELGLLRDQIDAIDRDLLRLINERAKLARRIGEIKQGNIYRPEREAQVLRRVAERNPGPLPAVAAPGAIACPWPAHASIAGAKRSLVMSPLPSCALLAECR